MLPLASAAVGAAGGMFDTSAKELNGLADLLIAAIMAVELTGCAVGVVWIVVTLRSSWRWPYFVYMAVFVLPAALFIADLAFLVGGGRPDQGGLVTITIFGLGAGLFLALIIAFGRYGVWGTQPKTGVVVAEVDHDD